MIGFENSLFLRALGLEGHKDWFHELVRSYDWQALLVEQPETEEFLIVKPLAFTLISGADGEWQRKVRCTVKQQKYACTEARQMMREMYVLVRVCREEWDELVGGRKVDDLTYL